MNKFLKICIVLCLAVSMNTQNITTLTKVKDFAMGLSIGMGALPAMPDALACVGEAGPLVSDIEAVIDYVKAHPSDIFGIIKRVENVTQEISQVLPTCKSLSAEGKAFFANIALHFTNSTLRNQGLFNILSNFEAVKQDVTDGITALKTGQQETDFIVAGSKFGNIISIFVNGNQQSVMVFLQQVASNATLVSRIEHALLGFVLGSQSLAQLPDALGCLNDVQTLKTEIQQLIADVQSKSIIDAIKVITEFVKQLNPDVTTCLNLKNELVAYGQDLEQLFTNQTRQVQGLQNLVQNFEEVVKSIETVVSSVRAGEDADYLNAGFALGDVFRIFSHGNQQVLLVAEPCKPGCLTLPNGSCDCIDASSRKFLN